MCSERKLRHKVSEQNYKKTIKLPTEIFLFFTLKKKSNTTEISKSTSSLHNINKKLTRIAHCHPEWLPTAWNVFSIGCACGCWAAANRTPLMRWSCGCSCNWLFWTTRARSWSSRPASASMTVPMGANQVTVTCWASTWLQQVLIF